MVNLFLIVSIIAAGILHAPAERIGPPDLHFDSGMVYWEPVDGAQMYRVEHPLGSSCYDPPTWVTTARSFKVVLDPHSGATYKVRALPGGEWARITISADSKVVRPGYSPVPCAGQDAGEVWVSWYPISASDLEDYQVRILMGGRWKYYSTSGTYIEVPYQGSTPILCRVRARYENGEVSDWRGVYAYAAE